MKIFGYKINWVKRTFLKDIAWGMVSCIFGIMLSDLVVEVSHYYSRWFFALCAFVFAMVILFRFEENWFSLWSNNKKNKKKKKTI